MEKFISKTQKSNEELYRRDIDNSIKFLEDLVKGLREKKVQAIGYAIFVDTGDKKVQFYGNSTAHTIQTIKFVEAIEKFQNKLKESIINLVSRGKSNV